MEKTVKEETFREKSERLSREFKNKKYLTKSMKDGSPIKTDHQSVHNHKIAALLFLIVDNGDEYPTLVKKCEEVVDEIYSRVDKLKKSVYLQNLQNKIEDKVAKNLKLQILLLSICLIQSGANSPIALELITMMNKIVDKNRDHFNHINVDNKLKRLHRIVKKNYRPMS